MRPVRLFALEAHSLLDLRLTSAQMLRGRMCASLDFILANSCSERTRALAASSPSEHICRGLASSHRSLVNSDRYWEGEPKKSNVINAADERDVMQTVLQRMNYFTSKIRDQQPYDVLPTMCERLPFPPPTASSAVSENQGYPHLADDVLCCSRHP
jgi:hypothetical protein